MNIVQKERILKLIDDLRRFTFYHPGDYPEQAEASLFDLQGKLEKLKVCAMRLEDEFIKNQISEIFTEFDLSDQREAMKQFNKSKALFEELEDYILQENYEAISGFGEYESEERLYLSDPKRTEVKVDIEQLKSIRKEISKGELDNAIESLITLIEEMGLQTDNLILCQNRLSNIRTEYNKGVIQYEVFQRLNTSIVVSVITELNKIKASNNNNSSPTDKI